MIWLSLIHVGLDLFAMVDRGSQIGVEGLPILIAAELRKEGHQPAHRRCIAEATEGGWPVQRVLRPASGERNSPGSAR